MAIVHLEFSQPSPGRVGGQVYYQRSGRTVLRRIVKPVDPRTVDQQRERVGTAIAARTWSLQSPSVKASFDDMACEPGWTGYWVWDWLLSALLWIDQLIPIDVPAVLVPGAPDVACLPLDPVTGMPVVLVSYVNPPTGAVASVGVSRPLSPGRFARRAETRTGPAVELEVETVVGDWYLAKFGGPPHPGQIMSYLAKVLSGVEPGMSCTTFQHCIPSVSDSCVTDPSSIAVVPLGSAIVDAILAPGCGSPGAMFSGVPLTAGWFLTVLGSVPFDTATPITLTDVDGTPRSETVEILWTDDDDPTCACTSSTSAVVS